MLILAAVCVILYALGAVLAYELTDDVEHPAKRLVIVVCWPSVALYLLMDR